jgi:hypothetical protein
VFISQWLALNYRDHTREGDETNDRLSPFSTGLISPISGARIFQQFDGASKRA